MRSEAQSKNECNVFFPLAVKFFFVWFEHHNGEVEMLQSEPLMGSD